MILYNMAEPIICLENIKENMFHVVDCKSGEPVKSFGVGGKVKSKVKRKPSAYNIHMGSCLKSLTGPIKERFRTCVAKWKAKK